MAPKYKKNSSRESLYLFRVTVRLTTEHVRLVAVTLGAKILVVFRRFATVPFPALKNGMVGCEHKTYFDH